MNPKSFSNTALLLIFLLAIFHISTMQFVPFHPDETSILTQSEDVERFLQDPTSLAWRPDQPQDQQDIYRQLNAPLPKYVIGISRLLLGCGWSALPEDWDWEDTWQSNIGRGAYPSDCTLLAGRLSSSLLVIAALPLMYLIAKRLGGEYAGLAALILFGSHALVLLHGRRAMAEGTMLFALILALWALLEADRRPTFTGISVALAVMSKYTPVALIPVGLIAAAWRTGNQPRSRGQISKNVFYYGIALSFTALMLSPILWRHPFGTAQAIVSARAEFTQQQIELTKVLNPESLLDTPAKRVSSMLANLYIIEPAIWDVGNYITELEPARQAYMSNFLHGWSNSLLAGGVMLILTISGAAITLLRFKRLSKKAQRELSIIALATLFISLTLLAAVPIPYQRYVLPLLPLALLWAAQAAPQKS